MEDNNIDLQPWDRQPGEPVNWFVRFDAFRALGPRRSVLAVYRAEREDRDRKSSPASLEYWTEGKFADDGESRDRRSKPSRRSPIQRVPRTWDEKVRVWKWRERANAWDEFQVAELRRAEAEDRRRSRIDRIRLLNQFQDKVFDAIDKMKTTRVPVRDIATAVRTVTEGLRSEYGDEVERVELGTPGDFRSPAELTDEELLDIIRRGDRAAADLDGEGVDDGSD